MYGVCQNLHYNNEDNTDNECFWKLKLCAFFKTKKVEAIYTCIYQNFFVFGNFVLV